jgi:lambda family phage portal protein
MTKPRFRVAAHADGRVVNVSEIASPRFGADTGGALAGAPYEGAQGRRRLFAFRATQAGPNAVLQFSGPALRARARHLVRNVPIARKGQRIFSTGLIGTGIRPIPMPKDEALKQPISDLWDDFVEESDADGLCDLYGQMELGANAIFEAGEFFIRFRPRFTRDGLTVPMQLQMLESEMCPYELNMIAANGNVVCAGIEFNVIGQRVAYYFWKVHPGEYMTMPGSQAGYTRVPAADVLHVFKPLRPGQIRGVSWLSTSIVLAYIRDQYKDAEVQRKLTAALFAGFIYRPANTDDDAPVGQQDQPGLGVRDTSTDADGEVVAGLTPGMMQYLEDGEQITFSEPADVGPNFEAFEYRTLLDLTSGMDVPYATATGDVSKGNFASQRLMLIDDRAAVRQRQRNFIFQLCKPVYRRFMSAAVLGGMLPVRASAFNAKPRDFVRASWIPPRLEWIDPGKDAQAEHMAMRDGTESREGVVLSRGRTLAENDASIARSNASGDAHGLVLDSDPRFTNARGSQAPLDVAAPPEQPGVAKQSEKDDGDEDAEEEAA